ncbi:MAG TPA: hypothetical protein VGC31_09120, partial [Paenirhodobacter sp.]
MSVSDYPGAVIPVPAFAQDDEVTIRSSRLRRWSEAGRQALQRPGFLIALAYLVLVLAAAAAPGLLASHDPYATAPLIKVRPPGPEHWFGTDELGRDLYTRVIHGARLSVLAALIAVAIAFVGGSGLGLVAGFFGGRIDAV